MPKKLEFLTLAITGSMLALVLVNMVSQNDYFGNSGANQVAAVSQARPAVTEGTGFNRTSDIPVTVTTALLEACRAEMRGEKVSPVSVELQLKEGRQTIELIAHSDFLSDALKAERARSTEAVGCFFKSEGDDGFTRLSLVFDAQGQLVSETPIDGVLSKNNSLYSLETGTLSASARSLSAELPLTVRKYTEEESFMMDDYHDNDDKNDADSVAMSRDSNQVVNFYNIRIATDADYEMFDHHNSEAGVNARVQAIVNSANGIYRDQLGTNLELVLQHVQTDINNPYTDPDSTGLFSSMYNFFVSTYPDLDVNSLHLITRAEPSGPRLGLSQSSVCSPNYHRAWSSDFFPNQTRTIFSHELGHGISFKHEDSEYIMNTFVNQNSLEFSDENKFSINQDAQNLSLGCLEGIVANPGADVASPQVFVRSELDSLPIRTHVSFVPNELSGEISHYDVYRSTNPNYSCIGTPIATNITARTYTDDNVQINRDYYYAVKVVGTNGSEACSDVVESSLEVPQPQVVLHESYWGVAGATLFVEVQATSTFMTEPFTWYVDGERVQGQDSNVLMLPNATLELDGAEVRVEADNIAGQNAFDTAEIHVMPGTVPVRIADVQPIQVYEAGTTANTAELEASIIGSPPIQYEWSIDGQVLPGGSGVYTQDIGPTGKSISLDLGVDADQLDGETINLRIENGVNSAETEIFFRYVITQQGEPPLSRRLLNSEGSEDFGLFTSAQMIGENPISYQWRRNSSPVPGATNANFVLSDLTIEDTGDTIGFTASNTNGFYSSPDIPITIYSNEPPTIEEQPQDQSATAGEIVTLSIEVSGDGKHLYQWYRNGLEIPGALEATYNILADVLDDGSEYYVTVRNGFGSGSLTSRTATLSVTVDQTTDTDEDGIEDSADNCIEVRNADQRDTDNDGYGNICDPDFNNDGEINSIDVGSMQSVFFDRGNLDQDLDGDGVVNSIDLGILRSFMFGSPGPSGLVN